MSDTLQEKLGIGEFLYGVRPVPDIPGETVGDRWRRMERMGILYAVERRDEEVVRKVADWLASQDLDGRDVPALLRRELLAAPAPQEGEP